MHLIAYALVARAERRRPRALKSTGRSLADGTRKYWALVLKDYFELSTGIMRELVELQGTPHKQRQTPPEPEQTVHRTFASESLTYHPSHVAEAQPEQCSRMSCVPRFRPM
jgi:hypothetical protein